jgi:CelD/BcsL family acetyltransferase involved in cellulose biosynthesis
VSAIAASPLAIQSQPSLEGLRDDWQRLAAADGNVFATFEWASAWWTHLGEGEELALASCRDSDGTTVAVLPLTIGRTGRIRTVRLLGHGPADRLAPICAPDHRGAVAGALRAFLATTGADLFVGEQMPAEEGWGAALGAVILERESSPALRTSELDWEGWLASRSRNFRQQVRRRQRQLEELGELRFRLTRTDTELERDLETLFELHAARWPDGQSVAFSGPRRELHLQFAAAALERGWLRLWTLELDGRPLACWYGFRFGGAEWFYQSGRVLDSGVENVGFVLMAHTLREAIADGIDEYRLLRGDEDYKARFSDTDPGLETIAVPLRPRGRVALAAQRLRPIAGNALRRLGLR